MAEPILNKSIKNGLITESAVSDNDFPKDAVYESINFNFDTIGRANLRSGTTRIGNQLSGNSLGLYHFVNSTSANSKLLCVNGTTVYWLNAGTWTAERITLTTGSKARFSTMLDYVFMVNGTESTAVWDGGAGTDFVTTGNALNAPKGKFISNYRARMWIAGNSTYPDRLYYSSIPSAVTTPIITWDTDVTTGDWIDISPSDGENITGLHRTKNCILVFKNNHIYQVFSVDQADPDPKFNVGTYSQESIVETKNGVYFHHPTGFYRYNGEIQEVSKPIIDIVNNISLANYSKVCGYVEPDGDHICWSIGNVTYKGITYSNMVVRYSISSQVWTHYTYPTQQLTSCVYNDGTSLITLVGDNDGNILKINTGNTDNGSSIIYSLTTSWESIDKLESTTKTINKIVFLGSGGTGTKISYQVNGDLVNDWTKKIGVMKKLNAGFDKISLKGTKFRFRLYGISKGESFTYEGYELLDYSSELITFT
jgi:hypothetical protein